MFDHLASAAKALPDQLKGAARLILVPATMAAAGLGLLSGKTESAEPMTGFVNGVASVKGLHGSDWRTDLWIHNGRNDYPVTVRLFYAPKGTPVNEQNFVPVVVQPGTTQTLIDVVGTAFAAQGSGGLFYQIIPQEFAEGVIVESNTYNRLGNGKQFGQQVPGRQWIDPNLEWGDPNKFVGEAGEPQFTPGPIDKARYRANLAWITNHQCNRARIIVKTNRSVPLVNQEVNVTPNTWYQWTDIVNKFGLQDQLNGLYITFVPLIGQAFSSVSVIDNKTNDASNFEGTNRTEVEYNAWLLAAAYLQGANNSKWRSDVFTINANVSGTTGINFFAFPRGEDNSGKPDWRGRDYMMGEAIIFPNILSDLFEYQPGTSATIMVNQLEKEPQRDLVSFMRTYSEEQNDQGETVTYGQAVHPVNWKDSLRNDLEGRMVGVAHNNNFRTNLILQNTVSSKHVRTDTPQDAIVEILKDDGTLLGSKTYHLLPGEYRQINKVAEDILGTGATIENATIVVKAPNIPARYRGGVIAAASVINGNTTPGTNDPRLIIAQPIDRFDPVDAAIEAYLNRWFPTNDAKFYLSSQEAYPLINGGLGVRSYVRDLATELYNDPVMQAGTTIDGIIKWLKDRADGNPNNSEFCSRFDPILWDNDAYGPPGFVVYGGLGCGPVDFKPGIEPTLRIYDMIRNDFLFKFIKANPELYGGKRGGPPDPNHDPTWNDGTGQ